MRSVDGAHRLGSVMSAILAAAVLAGCAGTPADPPSPSAPLATPVAAGASTSASPASSTSGTATTPSPSPTQADRETELAKVPAAARKRTVAGAEAFVRHFADVYLEINRNPVPGRILALCSAPPSTGCRAWDDTASELINERLHYKRDPVQVLTVIGAQMSPLDSRGYNVYLYVMDAVAPAYHADGTVKRDDMKPARLVVTLLLKWKSATPGWEISGIDYQELR